MPSNKLFHNVITVAAFGALFVTAGVTPASAADEWGNLKGKFVLVGTPPKLDKPDTTKEPLCKAHKVPNETLTVDANGGIKDVLVFCRTKDVKVKPELLADAKGEVVLDNKGCRFEPHILPMLVTQTLVVKNSDPFAHNSNITDPGGNGANPNLPPDAQAKYKYHKASDRLLPVACNIHGWMKAIVIPRDNPYFAVSKEDGTFEIKDLPVGTELEFQVMQEKAGNFKDDKANKWNNGKFKYKIKPGDNVLPDIKLDAKLFNK